MNSTLFSKSLKHEIELHPALRSILCSISLASDSNGAVLIDLAHLTESTNRTKKELLNLIGTLGYLGYLAPVKGKKDSSSPFVGLVENHVGRLRLAASMQMPVVLQISQSFISDTLDGPSIFETHTGRSLSDRGGSELLKKISEDTVGFGLQVGVELRSHLVNLDFLGFSQVVSKSMEDEMHQFLSRKFKRIQINRVAPDVQKLSAQYLFSNKGEYPEVVEVMKKLMYNLSVSSEAYESKGRTLNLGYTRVRLEGVPCLIMGTGVDGNQRWNSISYDMLASTFSYTWAPEGEAFESLASQEAVEAYIMVRNKVTMACYNLWRRAISGSSPECQVVFPFRFKDESSFICVEEQGQIKLKVVNKEQA